MQTRLLLAFALIIAGASAWMDPAWQYRTPVAVSNGGSALADYQVSVTLNTASLISAGKMRSDCGDLRFANSTDNQLSYWVESGCNTASTKAWVKDASVPSGSSVIYAYYGNPTAAGTGDGDSTFQFFDDFPGSSLNMTKWAIPGCSSYSVSGGKLQVKRQTCSTAAASVYTNQQTFGTWTVAKAKLQMPWGGCGGSYNYNYFGYSTNGNWGSNMVILAGSGNYICNGLLNYVSGWASAGISGDSNEHLWELRRTDTASYAYKDGALAAGPLSTQYPTASTGINFQNQVNSGTDAFYADWVFVRKYAATEPTTSPQSEEMRPPLVIIGISPASKAAYPNANETFSLWVYNNQSIADNFTLSCTGTCYYSENPVVTASQQNKSVTVTITTASVSSTTAYTITAASQANPANAASATASVTVDATAWRSQWTDAFNNTYAYRTPITISNNGSALSDYQVAINTTNLVYNNSGLVGSWHFSENGGTRFADSSGNGNDGTYNGETFNTGTLNNFSFTQGSGWIDGRYGKALKFDGINDYVSTGTSGFTTAGMSFSVWFKADSWSDYKDVFQMSTDGSNQNRMSLERSDSATYCPLNNLIWVTGSSASATNVLCSSTSVSPGNWYHVVVTFKSTGEKSIYVNGVLENSSTGVTALPSAIPSSFNIGYPFGNLAPRWFNGTIDEVRAYGRVLTAQEVAQIYQNNTFLRNGLAGYWRFDEGSGTTAQDTHHIATQDNRDGTKFGNALSFDGANDYVSVPSSASLNVSNALTVEAWVKVHDTVQSNKQIVSKWTSSNNNRWSLYFDSQRFWLGVGNGVATQYVYSTTLPQRDVFYHVIGTYNGSNINIYINGALENTTPQSGGIGLNNNPLLIGGFPIEGYSIYFNGTIDEVRVYNRSLSAQEIAGHYGAGKLRLDYADLRFVNSSNVQMPYWLESDNLAWVLLPYVPNGTSTVYAYYGSPGAQSAASGNATFDFFDDFPGITWDVAKWTQSYDGTPGSVTVSNGIAAITAGSNGEQLTSNAAAFSQNKILEVYSKQSGDGSNVAEYINAPINMGWRQDISSATPNLRDVGRMGLTYVGDVAGATLDAAKYHVWAISWRQGEERWLRDGANLYTDTNALANASATIMLHAFAGHTNYVDWARIRKYASPEPAGALLLEESANPAAILGVSPASKTTYPGATEQFNLSVYNNQTFSDGFALSCTGNCTYSENPVAATAYQNKTVIVTITSAITSGTTTYAITATSQANASNSASISASLTVDATKWRDQWTDAYNNGFRYRIPVTINNTGSALTDYQVNITIDSATPIGLARMRGDCGDIRITNGTNEMPYWIESGCNSTSTKIWARVPYVPAGNSTVYAYYGNSLVAGASNGTATFLNFDDAETGALTGKWFQDVGTSTSYSADRAYAGSKSIKVDTSSAAQFIRMPLSATPSAVEFEFYDDNDQSEFVDLQTRRSGPLDLSGIAIDTNQRTGYYIGLNGPGWVRPDNVARSVGWHRARLLMTGATTSAYIDGVALVNAYPDTNLPVDFIAQTVTTLSRYSIFYFDNFRVRRYVSLEPIASTGAEQSKGYRLLVRRCGLKQANATVTAYQGLNVSGSCLSNQYGICSLEIGAGIYDLQLTFADNSTAWKNGTAFG